MQKTILGALLASLLAGCATPHLTYDGMVETTRERTTQQVQEAVNAPVRKATPSVRVHDEAFVNFERVDRPVKRGDVTIKASASPFAPLMSEVAKRSGYSVVFADNVDVTRKVTAEFNRANSEDVLRNAAFLAGYVAVIDRDRRIVTVADTATYTFKLPSGIFSDMKSSYSVGGNASSTGGNSGGGGSGGGGGGSSGGAQLQAKFNINGGEGDTGGDVKKLIEDIAGGNSQVTVTKVGFLSVRGNAQSLRRVSEFLRKMAANSMTQVDIEATIVEVSLAKEFSMGIQWGKVIESANSTRGISGGADTAIGQITQDMNNGTNVVNSLVAASANPGVGAFRLGASSASLVKALAQFSDVKVVSQPHLSPLNNTSATMFDGSQIPYLGNLQQTAASTVGGAPTVSGSTSYAIDGLSFSVTPSVIDKDRVQIMLIPVLSTVGKFEKFQLGANSELTVPHQAQKQSFVQVLAETGKTLVIAGIRSGMDTKDTSVGVNTGSRSSTKEVVILLRAAVVPAADYDPVVAEAI